jgi:hypothetical protein
MLSNTFFNSKVECPQCSVSACRNSKRSKLGLLGDALIFQAHTQHAALKYALQHNMLSCYHIIQPYSIT